ncbi:MAG TPA: cysteine desulfurase [Candidatus Anaerostipes avicola]|nr:cysteine desulfurase family protein [uncultured Anaerostipes sp.]HJC82450.1 cysteine desulfurase [Candidatus Anaerostipes avicola]
MSIYLDYNASAPIDSRVLESMIEVYKKAIGNADSRTHNYGENARRIVEDAREQVASLLGVSSGEVFFTSGATESNNIAIQGLAEYAEETGKKHIITSSIEHKAVLETVKAMGNIGFDIDVVDPDSSGRVSAEHIISLVRDDTLLVSIMHVNNETGVIQPIDEIGNVLAEKNVLFHVDATQSCGKLVDEIKKLKYNMLSFSAHKLQGPQGIGVLVLRKSKYKFPPVRNIMFGGQQEHGIRPGTIPVALVAGCGRACEIAAQEYVKNVEKTKRLKGVVIKEFEESGLEYHFNGDQEHCISNTVNICIPGVMSEALMISSKQYCSISNGSACTSKSYTPSYVLSAMGISEEDIECSVRISWGPDISMDELRENIDMMLKIARQIKG